MKKSEFDNILKEFRNQLSKYLVLKDLINRQDLPILPVDEVSADSTLDEKYRCAFIIYYIEGKLEDFVITIEDAPLYELCLQEDQEKIAARWNKTILEYCQKKQSIKYKRWANKIEEWFDDEEIDVKKVESLIDGKKNIKSETYRDTSLKKWSKWKKRYDELDGKDPERFKIIAKEYDVTPKTIKNTFDDKKKYSAIIEYIKYNNL